MIDLDSPLFGRPLGNGKTYGYTFKTIEEKQEKQKEMYRQKSLTTNTSRSVAIYDEAHLMLERKGGKS